LIAGLNEVNGDLSGGQKKFHAALSKLKVKTPLGEISLNENRQATGSVFVTEVSANTDGTLSNKMVARVDNVTQTLGMTPDAFRAMGLPSRTTPDCKALGGK
jgi:branched-chain amino acid transport system substrate-binding protein